MTDKKIIQLKKSVQKYLRQNKTDAAISDLKELLSLTPKDISIRRILADLLEKKGEKAEATIHFQEVADQFLRDGFHIKGIAILKRILKMDPDNEVFAQKLAKIYIDRNLLADAEEIYLDLARRWEGRKNQEKAIEMYRKILEFKGDNPLIHDLIQKIEEKTLERARLNEEMAQQEAESDLSSPAPEPQSQIPMPTPRPQREKPASDQLSQPVEIELPESPDMPASSSQADLPEITFEFEDQIPDREMGDSPTAPVPVKAETTPDTDGESEPVREIRTESEAEPKSQNTSQKLPEISFDFEPENLDKELDIKPELPEITIADPKIDHIATKESEAPASETTLVSDVNGYIPLDKIVADELEAIAHWTKELNRQLSSTIERHMKQIHKAFADDEDQEVSLEDADTRYSLGMACMEMGLYEEALNEFWVALKDPDKEGDVTGLIAFCLRERGEIDLSIDWYEKALKLAIEKEIDPIPIQYELVMTYRLSGDLDRMKVLIEEIYWKDRDYREIKEIRRQLLEESELLS